MLYHIFELIILSLGVIIQNFPILLVQFFNLVMYLLLSKIIYLVFFFLVVFLFFINNVLNSTSVKKTSDKKPIIQKNIINFFSDEEGGDVPEKIKKILKIILYIILFFLGGFLLYYIYMFYLPVNFTIENALEQLKILIPEEKYNQISVVVFEMIDRPDKVSKGLHLLHLIKTLLKDDFPKEFEKIMDDIISFFEGKK
jgi:hypothetical protein